LLAFVALPTAGWAVELKVSRAALDRTLKQQFFSGPDGGITSGATASRRLAKGNWTGMNTRTMKHSQL